MYTSNRVEPFKRPDRATAPVKTSLGELELQCPPLPQTLLQAVDLMYRPDGPELDEVIKMVQHDPGVVARLLRVVNSAYYGQRGDIQSVQRAVVILGTITVTGIVMSMSLQDVRASLNDKTALPFLNLVRHSNATAYLARHLLANNPKGDVDQEVLGGVYTGALLHDFGKLVLLYNYPEVAANFYTKSHRDLPPDSTFLKEERNLFGYDHVETGVYLCRRLHFPEPLTTSVALHHRHVSLGDEDIKMKQLVYAVSAANKAASALGFGFNKEITWDACQEDSVWDQLIDEQVVGYPTREALLETMMTAQEEMTTYVDLVI